MTFDAAMEFCGYHSFYEYTHVGLAQLGLLVSQGMTNESTVLEIGAGSLCASRWLVQVVPNLHIIEPNHDLVVAAQKFHKHLRQLNASVVTNFYFGGTFDFILSHSILSHASDKQLPELMDAIYRQLNFRGVALISLRLTEEDDKHAIYNYCDAWCYPESRYFTPTMVEQAANDAGLTLEWRPDWRNYMMGFHRAHYHDWIKLTKQ
jgi:cyclopropane fatty-acyl-phospholipid synthase-like methyltransferase